MKYSAILIAVSASVLPTVATSNVQRRDTSARVTNANTPPVTVKGNGEHAAYMCGNFKLSLTTHSILRG